jgi:hypothetical protein
MDKHKQFTETIHPVGTVLEPASSDNTPVLHEAPPLESSSQAGDTAPVEANTSGTGRIQAILSNRYALGGIVGFGLLLLVGGSIFVGQHYMKKGPQVVTDSTKLDQKTLLIDSDKHSVGVVTTTGPDGLEVQATVSATPQDSANIRMGLIKGTDPSILFEDSQKNSWQVLAASGSFQIIQGTQARAKLDDKALSLTNALNVGSDATVTGTTSLNGSTNIGKDGSSLLTIQGTKVAIPNNLNFANNTFVIEGSKGNVAVGAASASGYKLLVAGSIKSNSNIYADGQVLAGAGSAKNPSFAFNNNTNTGIYEVALNVVGVSAAGSQVLQVQPGVVFTVNGANIEADGYLRAGRGGSNPFFQIMRYTGTLDGSGSATVATGLGTGNTRVLSVQAFYRGNGNEALPLNIDAVNGSSVVISGGIPGRQYRTAVIYSSDAAGW